MICMHVGLSVRTSLLFLEMFFNISSSIFADNVLPQVRCRFSPIGFGVAILRHFYAISIILLFFDFLGTCYYFVIHFYTDCLSENLIIIKIKTCYNSTVVSFFSFDSNVQSSICTNFTNFGWFYKN